MMVSFLTDKTRGGSPVSGHRRYPVTSDFDQYSRKTKAVWVNLFGNKKLHLSGYNNLAIFFFSIVLFVLEIAITQSR